MEQQQDKINTGKMFFANEKDVLRLSGYSVVELKNPDKETDRQKLIVMDHKDRDNNDCFLVYQSIGVIYKNSDTSNNRPDVSGNVYISTDTFKMRFSMWKNASAEGNTYYNVQLAEPRQT